MYLIRPTSRIWHTRSVFDPGNRPGRLSIGPKRLGRLADVWVKDLGEIEKRIEMFAADLFLSQQSLSCYKIQHKFNTGFDDNKDRYRLQ